MQAATSRAGRDRALWTPRQLSIGVSEQLRAQLRIEAFNVTNHANFGVPVNDLVSPNFGRILKAGSPRVFQAALKILF
jgi:hypothetical protein